MSKLSEIGQRVKGVLINFPAARDNYHILLGIYWQTEYTKAGMTAPVFGLMMSGFFTKPESITRASRKLQEEIPSLRGKGYNYRRQISEPEFKEDVKQFILDL